jgi:hypothetical protein
MAIPDYARTNFDTLLRAAGNGNLALMECLDVVTRQPRYVLCAVGRSDGDYVFTPCGHLAEDNPYEAWASLVDGSSVAVLAGDLSLRRARVMNDYRIELTGFTNGMRDWLKAAGLFSEIIAWRTRFFVPTTEEGPAILERLIERHRLLELSARG